MDFLATHDAWRGYPRIHVCQERLKGIPGDVVQGVIHHEISHALQHGTREFYTFRFSSRLQQVGRTHGLGLSHLQQCVYFLSVAIKDREAVQQLAEKGLAFSQVALLEHLISDTEDERLEHLISDTDDESRIWEVVRGSPVLRKIALAAFLKVLLPIQAMISVGIEEAQTLRDQWNEAYGWLSEKEQEDLLRLAQRTMNLEGGSFQERLEQAVLQFIT